MADPRSVGRHTGARPAYIDLDADLLPYEGSPSVNYLIHFCPLKLPLSDEKQREAVLR
jgi:hypothetical protein